MPTILTPQGWVKVSEPPNKRRTIAVDPADALKGPLAYFSCKRTPPKVLPGVLHLPTGVTGGKKNSSREAFPYDLNASPEKLRAQGRGIHGSQVEKVKIGGKNRTVSAPVPGMRMEESDPYYSEEEEAVHRSRRGHSPPPSPSRTAASHPSRHHESKHSKHHHHKHRGHHHHDDVSSVSSGSTSSCSSSSSSYRSHRSHERARPIQAAPQPPIIMYTTAPPAPAPSGPRYYNYDSPRHPPPPSTGSARSMSYSWYNATTPLNL